MSGVNKLKIRLRKHEESLWRDACDSSGIPELSEFYLATEKLSRASVGTVKKAAIKRALVEIMVALNVRIPASVFHD